MPVSLLRAAFGAVLLLLSALPAHAGVKVQVDGISGGELENVEARLSLRQRAQAGALDESQVRRLHEQAEREIREALQPFGFYDPEIASELDGSGENWTARYRVQLGPPTRIARVEARFEGEGASLDALAAALERFPLRQDERAIHADYEAAKQRMSDAALANGFLDAQWKTAELRVEPEARQARATLILDTGPRYFFGEITLLQDGLRPGFIERYIGIVPGAPFDPRALLDLQFRLSDLGYFDSVEIDPQRDLADTQRRVPVEIRTTPRARTRYDFGVGYGTDTGARLSVGTDWRRLNRRGHTLNTDFRLSEIKNTLGGTYRVPLGTAPDEYLGFTAATETERLDAGDTLKYVLGASLNRSPGDWQRRLYLEYTHEESEFGEDVATADLLTPGVAFTRSHADDPIYARRGWYLFADVHGAMNKLLSNTSFVQGRVLGRGVHALTPRWRLLARAEFGYSLVEEFGELPASQRFFAGGDQSVRGYKYQSIGPRDEDGNVIGGRYLSVFSAESEWRVWNHWGAALFVDSGGADDDPGPNLSTGAGVGLRYRAPIGSLQLDVAHPFDDPDSRVRIHIGIRVGV